MGPLLEVEDLRTYFPTRAGLLRAVDGVSFSVGRGETVGIVGESGCGKSMTALSIVRLVPEPGRVTGRIIFDAGDGRRDVVQMSDDEIRELRGGKIAMIFQDPMTSLNPLHRVGDQIREAITAHAHLQPRAAERRVVRMLEKVRIPGARQRAASYPHQFSGGMRQRAMIAMGLANEPSLLIADEPTQALDVTVQAELIELLRALNRESGTAIILITHNLALVASLCARVMVMYAGRVVEQGPTREVFKSPQHPYTWSLLDCIPRVDLPRGRPLRSIAGMPPDLSNLPRGCKFHPRCRFRVSRCEIEEPSLENVADGHDARCWVPMRSALSTGEVERP